MNFDSDINQIAPFVPFIDAVIADRREVCLSGLMGGAVPCAIASAIIEEQGPTLIVVKDPASARTMLRDLSFFLGGPESETIFRLRHYPALDVSPFESISPHTAILAKRMAVLAGMMRSNSGAIAVATVEALMERIIPREEFSSHLLETFVDDLLDRDEFALELVNAGYSSSPMTEDYGDFSVRGGIIDLFCPLYENPLRIELDDIEVQSIRFFDPATQVTKKHAQRIKICPARQILLTKEKKELFAKGIKELSDQLDTPKQKRDQLVENIEQGIYFPGVEFFLPLFYENLSTVFDYLPDNTNVFIVEPGEIEAARDAFEKKIWTRRERASEAGKLVCMPEQLYLSAKQFDRAMSQKRQIKTGLDAYPDSENPLLFRVETQSHEELRDQILEKAQEEKPLAPLVELIREVIKDEGRCLLVCSSPSGTDRMERMLAPYEFRAEVQKGESFREALGNHPGAQKVPILLGELSAGFSLPKRRLTVICEEEVFGVKKRTESVARFRGEALSSFSDLAKNDYIVHVVHGVGIYRNLVQLEVADVPGEYLLLEYAKDDKLYLPVHRLFQVQRFVGSGGAPVIDRLGGQSWEKLKSKAKVAARAIARELLQLYAKRAGREGFGFDLPDRTFSEFESTFDFEETPDQITSIADVIEDMVKPRPMDRLICGDVGFGKTEVALRAAFLAVLSGKQVAVLVPTTTLAFQHYRTFIKRLESFGVSVAMLSRFTPTNQVKRIYEQLAKKKLDLVVGTHKLLSQKVRFADLGLLVVDEEQHFGVIQKEKIKALKEQVDVLSMTATPIPRTLNMALSGIYDLSVINTPPEDRLAVRTFITQWDEDTLREAILRELQRGGQIFFVHNRIRTIDSVAHRVQQLAPNARVVVAHGQMNSRTIEDIMIRFAEHKVDILVSTAIIESGLDFPKANTIFIHRADNLGLSQLYQLRGRVGRAKRRAYCYLIIPGDKAITKDARKRLAVLRTLTALGSGYKIAARDMEIRGAGNLLGEQQSGQINAIGFELFTQLLDLEIRRLKGEDVQEKIDPEISLQIPAYLPEDYVSSVGQRLSLYKRLSDAGDLDQTDKIEVELVDRFGLLPEPVRNLIRVMEIKIRARNLSIMSIEGGPETITYAFDDCTSVRPSTLVGIASKQPERFKLLPDGRLVEKTGVLDTEGIFIALKKTLQLLV